MLLRSNNGYIYRSDSTDYGQTWCQAYPTELPNNNSGIDLAKFENGTLILAYNPIKGNWGSRRKLALALSYDNGQTWTDKYIVDRIPQGDDSGGAPKELSYPAIIAIGEGNLAIAYTYNRKNIAFVTGSLKDILKNLVPA
jgi:predicted neuraminidase